MSTSALPLRESQIETFGNRSQWVEARQSGIGASESAAILGVSGAFGSALSVYADKLGMLPDCGLDEVEHIKWGNRLELPIIEGYAEDSNRLAMPYAEWLRPQIDRPINQYMIRHATVDCMFCTPDAYQHDDDRGPGILQIKTANAFKGYDWTDQPPLPYIVQVQHEMACTGAAWATLACLVGGNKLKWFDIDRDDRFIQVLEDQCQAFWRRVVMRDPPPADGSEHSAKAIKGLFPYDSGDAIELPELADTDRELQDMKDAKRTLEKKIESLEQSIKLAIGDASEAVIGKAIYSWRTSERAGFTVAPSTARTLRRKAAKGE